MITSTQRDDTAANLDLVGKLSVAVVPLSFVIGLATLAGRCFAIGGPAWSYVGFSDAVAAATKSAPLAFVLLAVATVGFALYATRPSATTGIPDQTNRVLNRFRYARNGLVVIFIVVSGSTWFLLGWKPALVLGFLLLLMAATAQITMWASPGSRLPKFIVGLSLGLVCAASVAAISYVYTRTDLLGLPERVQTHTICWDASDPTKCEYGLIVARFSDTTVFRGNDGGFNYIPNSEIKRVRGVTRDQLATSDRSS
ncbi:hypothetical protein EHI47_26485 [Rhizobium leguminosarum]|uniref:Uncharacterized protein n=1 Tax=Rhizobium leguminosarum TaxID=384 RepID=A0A444HQZ6_RHILE|nr:hypothetical protein [Rhizobium leguminosarum]RWX25245.1 hypothetical protein EHI47_26485 [Rhizobium leguminosarum]